MRIISGLYRGRTIQAPKKAITRPTTDRAREGIFNSLGSMGGIDGYLGVDLFAGSGSLGIEALSRGAEHMTFVDHDNDAVETVKKNLLAVGAPAEEWSVVRRDVTRFTSAMTPVDIAFIDPPFAISDEEWRIILSQVKATLIVGESNRDIQNLFPEAQPASKVRTYGDSVVVFAERLES